MRKSWFLLLLIVFTFAASGAVYKWVDQTGEVHYSDQRVPGAERIELPKSSVYTPSSTQKQTTGRQPAGVTASAGSYDSLAISSPGDDETIHSNEQKVSVSISIQPALAEGDRFRLFLDGAAVSGEHATPQITLQNVERGAHTLTVTVVDRAGKELIGSAPVTFYLRKISLLTVPGRPVHLPELPESEGDTESETPDEGNGEEEVDGEGENGSEGTVVRPLPDRPGNNPYAPNYRPSYNPAPRRTR